MEERAKKSECWKEPPWKRFLKGQQAKVMSIFQYKGNSGGFMKAKSLNLPRTKSTADSNPLEIDFWGTDLELMPRF